VREVEADAQAMTQRDVAELRAEIQALRRELRAAKASEAEPSVD
jgi:polyhydroxyalkanoate synthesis regulator phasin